MLIKALPYHPDPTPMLEALLDQAWPILLDSTGLGRFDIISANPSHKFTGNDWQAIKNLLAQNDNHAPDDLPFCGGALGYFGYDLPGDDAITPRIAADISLPPMAIGIYPWALITDHHAKTTTYVHQHDDATHWVWLQQQLACAKQSSFEFALKHSIQPDQSQQDYFDAFHRIKQYIVDGDCYQVNLAQRFSAPFHGDAYGAYRLLRQHNPAPFSSFMRIEQADILSCSPERFIQVHQDRVETKPIKGTRPRHHDPIIDQQYAEQLQDSEKDRAENLMIVDLLRNDLAKCCLPGSIKVPSLFALESYPAVHHLVSTVTGQLKPELTAIDCLQHAFPGGSITGAPKIRAMQIIEELENYRRNIYCGSIGYIGFNGHMDSNIAIRTCVASQQQFYCWAGGGLVADSEPHAEYQETLDKISRITRTLNQTVKGSHDAVV